MQLRHHNDSLSRMLLQLHSNNMSQKSQKRPLLDHFNARKLKVFFRCWVAVWVASLLIFINPAASNFGQATFFAWSV